MRVGNSKAIRTHQSCKANVREALPTPLERYDLSQDAGEINNVAAQRPDVVSQLGALLQRQHVKRAPVPLGAPDGSAD